MTRAQLIHATMRVLSMPVTAEVGELGWTADPAYLVDAAGTYLGRSNQRYFYKTNNGVAIGVFGTDISNQFGRHWYGPYLISTDQDSVAYYYGSTYLGAFGSIEYGGLLWYYNSNHHYTNASFDLGDLPAWGPFSGTKEEEILAILETARVRIGKGGFALWP